MSVKQRVTLRRACVVVLLCVGLLVVSVAAVATPAAEASTPTSRYSASPIPAFERFFAQTFRVSVVTQSYGAFNASLRMRGSLNFPERVQGELILLGEPRLHRQSQTPLPHFSRVRGVEDEKLSGLPYTVGVKSSTGKSGGGEFVATGEEERPSLLLIDLQLSHSDGTQGRAQAYYLPAELMALRAAREQMTEGSATPAAAVDFTSRMEMEQMSANPLSDVAPLARVVTGTVVAGESASASTSSGEFLLRWITEHEFSAVLTVAVPVKDSADAARPERVVVYGYATPSDTLFDRKQRQVPWYNKYLMIGVALMGFVVQVISGWTEGKTKAYDEAETEKKLKTGEQAKLEAAVKVQDRHSKKKK